MSAAERKQLQRAREADQARRREPLETKLQRAQALAALEKAFELGLERRESAAGQVKLPVSLGPRFVTALCQATCDGLFRSAATDSTVFVARG
jgi:hypothetical protein